mmetsp:Transcript_18603/g.41370  ORF Transcript_18603/g.41370 Transcript_18603/m.41370 type:complete len:156 (+) Transcript_18603:613-1080(+)
MLLNQALRHSGIASRGSPEAPANATTRIASGATSAATRGDKMVYLELDEAVRRLSENDPTLTRLALKWYSVHSADGAAALAEALRENKTLTTLVLEHNDIGKDGAKAIAEALSDNATLTTLNLSGNYGINSKLQDRIQRLVEVNAGSSGDLARIM